MDLYQWMLWLSVVSLSNMQLTQMCVILSWIGFKPNLVCRRPAASCDAYKNHETESHCACRVNRVISLGDLYLRFEVC